MNPLSSSHVTLKQLRAFVAAAESPSFTAASRELHITQSALSALIRELEGQLDIKLFDRTTRSILLTSAGRELFPVLQKILADLSVVMSTSRELVTKARGRVTVAASPLLSSTLIPDLIERFSAEYPGIDIALRDSIQTEVQQKVQRGEADVGIGTYDHAEPEVMGEPVLSDRHLLACPASHPFGKRRSVDIKRLQTLPLVTFARGNSTRELLDKRFASLGATLQPRYEVAFLWTAIAMVNVGLGYAVVPAQVSGLKGVFPRVAFFRLSGFEDRREICLLTHASRSLSPAAEQFCKFARAHLPKLDAYKTLTPMA